MGVFLSGFLLDLFACACPHVMVHVWRSENRVWVTVLTRDKVSFPLCRQGQRVLKALESVSAPQLPLGKHWD